MYTQEYLSKYPYFKTVLETIRLTTVHDSLTGLVARPYMLQFLHEMIREGVPFNLAILDLDNFKDINDNYGHEMGDKVLKAVGEGLANYVGEKGIVGRFGGDEFLMIQFAYVDYDGIHTFYDGLYDGTTLFRRDYEIDGRKLYITCTMGSAVFPTDANDFEALFHLIDKTLYRGKAKGRNCFIIYVPKKHQKLEITTLARHSLYKTFTEMTDCFDRGDNLLDRLRLAFRPMEEHLRFYALYYIDREGELVSVRDGAVLARNCLPRWQTEGDMFTPRVIEDLEAVCPILYDEMRKMYYQGVLLLRMKIREKVLGYIVICPEPHAMRVWQDDEFAAAFFLTRLVGEFLSPRERELEE